MKGYIVVLLCFASISIVVAQQCGVNEKPSNCKYCIRTCENYKNPSSCSVECVSGRPRFCNCIEDYVYEYEGGECIPPQQCPQRACASNGAGASDQGSDGSASSFSSSSSGGNSAASSSSSSASGGNGGGSASSSSSSSASDYNSAASAASSASASQSGYFSRMFEPKQGPYCNRPNEEFSECGTACEPTCYNRYPSNKACAQQCKAGCRCKEGFVRDKEGYCINPYNCDACLSRPNEVYTLCSKNCEQSCENPNPNQNTCSRPCVEGCRCIEGFYRKLGICVDESQCQFN